MLFEEFFPKSASRRMKDVHTQQLLLLSKCTSNVCKGLYKSVCVLIKPARPRGPRLNVVLQAELFLLQEASLEIEGITTSSGMDFWDPKCFF